MHCANQVNNRDWNGILFPSRQTFAFCTICQPWYTSWTLLVSTYVVCERLSVMHQPARLPENFDQISPKHPCSGILHRTPPSPRKMKNSNFLSWVQIWAYPEHTPSPRKMKNSNFLSWVQIWAYPEHTPPPKMKNSNFLSWVQILAYPEHPPPKMKNSNFLSWVQIWAYPEHPAKMKTLTFFPEFRSELTENTAPPRKWKL